MSRLYKPVESAIDEDKEALPNTKQRLQITILGSPWGIDEIDERVTAAFRSYNVDYTVFGDEQNTASYSVRSHNGRPADITRLGVEYDGGHRTYDDIVIDGRETPPLTYWFDESQQSEPTQSLDSLDHLLQNMTVSRLRRKTKTGRYMSPYQRDQSA